MNPEKVFETKAIIRFPDCDPFNHLNNGRYIDYFLNAREDHLLKFHGFNLYEVAMQKGVTWVTSKNQIAYLKPALLMETVVIQSTLLRWGEKDVQVEMLMWNEDKTILKAVLWSSFIHFNLKTQKAIEHLEELTTFFKPFENPLDKNVSFDERIIMLKKEFSNRGD